MGGGDKKGKNGVMGGDGNELLRNGKIGIKEKGLAGGKDKNWQGKKCANGCEISALVRDADDKTISICELKEFPL